MQSPGRLPTPAAPQPRVYARATLETLVRLAGVAACLPVEMLDRRRVRAVLKLSSKGKLDVLGITWLGKR
jgi:hypothetical protein